MHLDGATVKLADEFFAPSLECGQQFACGFSGYRILGGAGGGIQLDTCFEDFPLLHQDFTEMQPDLGIARIA